MTYCIDKKYQRGRIYIKAVVIPLLIMLSWQAWCEDPCQIKFKNSTLLKARSATSLKELYNQTKDVKVKAVNEEIEEVMEEIKTFWEEMRKRRIVNGTFSENGDEFVKAIAWKKDYGITWHEKNIDLVDKARKIFKKHPCLRRITIARDGMLMFLYRHDRGIIFQYTLDYSDEPEDQTEILNIEKEDILIKKEGNFYFFLSGKYEPDILLLSQGHIYFVCDEDDMIIEMRGRKPNKP